MNDLNIIILVIISCIITALSRIVLKKGLSQSNAITGMVYSLFFGWLVLTVFFFSDINEQRYSTEGLLFFAAVGVIAPPFVRYMTYIGVEKLGAARSDTIRSLTPLFAVVFAFIFFNEQFSQYSLIAAALIVLGAWFLGRDAHHSNGDKVFKFSDLLYPFVAAVVAGLVSNLRKIGMNLDITSLAAATTAATSAIFVFSLFLIYKENYKRIIINRDSIRYLLLAGGMVGITDIIDLIALKKSKVSIVAPLLATTPLFVIFFSWIFLRQVEKITRNLLIGAILIFGGVVIIALRA